jgi:quinol monooxygenase YgiN
MAEILADAPVTTLVTYLPKPGREAALLDLVRGHWPVLRRLDLATETVPLLWRATDKRSGRISFVELFEWTNAAASETAHHTPEVMAVWEAMGPLLDGLELKQVDKVA